MNEYLFKLQKDLLLIVKELIQINIIDSSFNFSNLSIDYLSKVKQGDVSTNLFILLNNNLLNREYDLKKDIENKLNNLEYIKKIEIAKAGFINIFFNEEFIIENIKNIFDNSLSYGNNNSGQNKEINVEFVSANPTGPIHIAHIRGAVLGDVLSKIFESTGYIVNREYYVNDAGSQIEILGNSLFKRYQQLFNIKINISENEYPGEYLISIAKKIFTKDKDKWLNFDKNKRQKYFQDFAIKEILKTIKDDLKSINIIFNNYVHESDIITKRYIDDVFSILNKKDLLYEGYLEKPKGEDIIDWEPRKQLLFKSTKYLDDKDRPFKKNNGDWTYFANDSAYHYYKYLRNYYQLINIWGSDHIGYIDRMKSIVQAISNKKNYLDIRVCQIVKLYQNGKIFKMSKREGNFVTLKEILKKVNKDAIRYFMISSKSETPMDFDMNKVIEKNKDNPVYYCQYAYARASSIINKAKNIKEFKKFDKSIDKFSFKTLSDQEIEIIQKILSWPYLLNQVSIQKQPHKITNYLENLCSHFHSFWNLGKTNESLRMLDINDIEKTLTKLIWIESFRIVLQNAFKIIGIDYYENM